ncbi:MAG: UDP-2,3-diacylglucosamine diphosphatase [Limnobacter sp.]|nr:UDP-2,3-diacylglucosamine diphosphatase [Limnobacter sp.]
MIEIHDGASAFFASDFHLSSKTPKTLEAFENWLISVAHDKNLIFLLGDLFEVWCGDDFSDSTTERVTKAISQGGAAGARVFFMHGNRDFLLGETFAQTCNLEILPDPEFVMAGNQIIVLSHGDSFCTDDKAYQRFKTESRKPQWQAQFLSQPLEQRIALAQSMRSESTQHKKESTMDIMDANPDAVLQAFKGRWPDGIYVGRSHIVLHGHTHRPAVHRHSTQQTSSTPDKRSPDNHSQPFEAQVFDLEANMRIVLPDWDFDTPRLEKNSTQPGKPKGGYVVVNATGKAELVPLPG